MVASAYGVLAGGRPNSISGGINAFAGVVNPANSVWIADRVDLGIFLVRQKSSIDNRDNNPLYLPGKTDLNYKAKTLFTSDAAIHKKIKLRSYESSFSLATYTLPSYLKLRTKRSIPAAGITPVRIENKIQAISAIFSFKINVRHSIGLSIDYFYLSHLRNGFQRSDNRLRSVSPGHVTNNGVDHSNGIGLSLGWRWNITQSLTFGVAYVKKSYVGQYRKYRGFEPYHAKNYIPQTIGAGFTCQFSKRFTGRLEVLWANLGNLPNANNNILPNGKLNLNKRGSNKSPSSGLQDATFINLGIGYIVNKRLSIGMGYSHRIKLPRSSNILSHTYTFQTIYDILSLGINYNYYRHEFFLSFSSGFKNRVSGYLPKEVGGGKLVAKKCTSSLSVAWGYLY